MRLVIAVAVGFLTAATGGAAAQPEALSEPLSPDAPATAEAPLERIDRFSAELVGGMLDTLGLPYTVGQGLYGQPAITVVSTQASDPSGAIRTQPARPDIGGFEVEFFGCDNAGRCDEMSLVSRYEPDRPTSLTTVNRFNQGTRFTTAYTGPGGELILSMDLSAVGGIGRQATMIMIAIYVYNMESFAQAIGYS